MKKIIILFLLLAGFYFIFVNKKNTKSTISSTNKQPLQIENKEIKSKNSLFVPYWALGKRDYVSSLYDAYYYFGITVDQKGLIKTEPGYTGLAQFSCPNKKKCYLVIRMLDNEISKSILTDIKTQEIVIKQTLNIADMYSFSGVALDLELSGIFNGELTGQISSFVQRYYTSTKKNYKTFSFIVYGDNYYRKRPFDIKSIGTYSDEVMVMAYDFHKNYGEPGPNFPFDRRPVRRSLNEGGSLGEGGNFNYGYNFQQMIFDFSADVSPKKLTIIFGMYGYDWTLNAQGLPLKRGKAVTVKEIDIMTNDKSQITNQFPSFVKTTEGKQNLNSKEKKIEYIDAENFKHVIYYEDEESAAIKADYLRKVGIGSVSFWAWGYF